MCFISDLSLLLQVSLVVKDGSSNQEDLVVVGFSTSNIGART